MRLQNRINPKNYNVINLNEDEAVYIKSRNSLCFLISGVKKDWNNALFDYQKLIPPLPDSSFYKKAITFQNRSCLLFTSWEDLDQFYKKHNKIINNKKIILMTIGHGSKVEFCGDSNTTPISKTIEILFNILQQNKIAYFDNSCHSGTRDLNIQFPYYLPPIKITSNLCLIASSFPEHVAYNESTIFNSTDSLGFNNYISLIMGASSDQTPLELVRFGHYSPFFSHDESKNYQLLSKVKSILGLNSLHTLHENCPACMMYEDEEIQIPNNELQQLLFLASITPQIMELFPPNEISSLYYPGCSTFGPLWP